jgi:hypothetical protein
MRQSHHILISTLYILPIFYLLKSIGTINNYLVKAPILIVGLSSSDLALRGGFSERVDIFFLSKVCELLEDVLRSSTLGVEAVQRWLLNDKRVRPDPSLIL